MDGQAEKNCHFTLIKQKPIKQISFSSHVAYQVTVTLLVEALSQQQSSSSSSNRFIEHDVSTWKLGPSLGIRPRFLNRPIYKSINGSV